MKVNAGVKTHGIRTRNQHNIASCQEVGEGSPASQRSASAERLGMERMVGKALGQEQDCRANGLRFRRNYCEDIQRA